MAWKRRNEKQTIIISQIGFFQLNIIWPPVSLADNMSIIHKIIACGEGWERGRGWKIWEEMKSYDMHKCFVVEQHKRSRYVSVKTDTTSAFCLRCFFPHAIDQEMSQSILYCIAIWYLYPIWLSSNCHLMRITLYVEYDKQTMVLFEFVHITMVADHKDALLLLLLSSTSHRKLNVECFWHPLNYANLRCKHDLSMQSHCVRISCMWCFNSNEWFAHIFSHMFDASCDRVSSIKLITLVTAYETHAHWCMKMKKTAWIVQVFALGKFLIKKTIHFHVIKWAMSGEKLIKMREKNEWKMLSNSNRPTSLILSFCGSVVCIHIVSLSNE